ncbi:ArdC family protein [Heyndrickxia camelliae]|uniref:N-terminal domain-containing protein n=1 Tax=Heyndrickxia camelliae TaxID=1707093 RepID=A0A2N3LEN6_9BACI|nr:ArdC family protein [Heyndrickxia camelliae]PKR83076.1 hypothetical protein CWO92_21300 [Heyndrickxia camelliae]
MVQKRFKKKTFAERNKEMQDNYQKLIDGVKSTIASPEDYKRYLEFASHFPTRSFRNQMLIFLQDPKASFVAGLVTWNKLGRKIKKGAKSLKILAPIKVKEIEKDKETKEDVEVEVIKGFKLASVFDIRDTSGVPLPMNPIIPKEVNNSEFAEKVFYPLIENLRRDLPIELDKNYQESSNGYYSILEHKIVINANKERDITNQFKTLIHEYAHSVFHNETGKYYGYDKQTKELQAESVAYLVSKSFGMDTSDYSFPYIKGWAQNNDEKLLLTYQEDIQNESAAIIKRIENVVLEHNITFDVPVILQENTSSIATGEKKLSLIQFGDNFTIVFGDIKEGTLNNLESIKKLGTNYKDKEIAEKAFEMVKGHVPLHSVKQIDNSKGKTHIYKRMLMDLEDNQIKPMFFVGIPSMTDVKALTSLTTDLAATKREFQNLTGEELNISEYEQIEKDLSSRDLDHDGMTDLQELKAGTNPLNPDSDNDGVPDNIDVDNQPKQKGLALTFH